MDDIGLLSRHGNNINYARYDRKAGSPTMTNNYNPKGKTILKTDNSEKKDSPEITGLPLGVQTDTYQEQLIVLYRQLHSIVTHPQYLVFELQRKHIANEISLIQAKIRKNDAHHG